MKATSMALILMGEASSSSGELSGVAGACSSATMKAEKEVKMKKLASRSITITVRPDTDSGVRSAPGRGGDEHIDVTALLVTVTGKSYFFRRHYNTLTVTSQHKRMA